ncbi:hypothetical protein DFJ73DRAFT_816537 [Zopfochytrium polystomum]|nr:hypothetical protein DFJ73DRAFT_816537 [Zopfochytrium polystomum]
MFKGLRRSLLAVTSPPDPKAPPTDSRPRHHTNSISSAGSLEIEHESSQQKLINEEALAEAVSGDEFDDWDAVIDEATLRLVDGVADPFACLESPLKPFSCDISLKMAEASSMDRRTKGLHDFGDSSLKLSATQSTLPNLEPSNNSPSPPQTPRRVYSAALKTLESADEQNSGSCYSTRPRATIGGHFSAFENTDGQQPNRLPLEIGPTARRHATTPEDSRLAKKRQLEFYTEGIETPHRRTVADILESRIRPVDLHSTPSPKKTKVFAKMELDFSSKAWCSMKNHLAKMNLSRQVLRVSIVEVLKAGYDLKVAELTVMLTDVKVSNKDAGVELTDPSGSIRGSVHHGVIEKYEEAVRPGCVLLLKNTSILRAPGSVPSLIVTIYNIQCYARPDGHFVALKHSGGDEIRE